ncbi:hypothetical protein [Chitinophaga filiformis]|uniref:Uncharacterized protein n=1 Tax=Chitinophaga filiformis TaxID=104663 RepID=A0ABY4I8S5_CHIFI|nr:hypothetical protein [Chitinophaga filiformis]UPK72487.1 hypothetical protein MYF79_14435 [Chitinophaga filiformis]
MKLLNMCAAKSSKRIEDSAKFRQDEHWQQLVKYFSINDPNTYLLWENSEFPANFFNKDRLIKINDKGAKNVLYLAQKSNKGIPKFITKKVPYVGTFIQINPKYLEVNYVTHSDSE